MPVAEKMPVAYVENMVNRECDVAGRMRGGRHSQKRWNANAGTKSAHHVKRPQNCTIRYLFMPTSDSKHLKNNIDWGKSGVIYSTSKKHIPVYIFQSLIAIQPRIMSCFRLTGQDVQEQMNRATSAIAMCDHHLLTPSDLVLKERTGKNGIAR